ncbi:unnamed protein product [Clonostachys solani]|uniref:NADAR domain-containing protein n=1 Tax=Clonostachys solani TaxID=160281 RepID=A0A9N9WB85_9HYPO|nr:unnamed protein product [Clonostachys solani]
MRSKSRHSRVDSDSSPKGDDPLFFYMPNAKWGEFCQWFPCTFTVSKGEIAAILRGNDGISIGEAGGGGGVITFNCAEQFMMYCKASCFHDFASQTRILATASSKEQKAFGKTIQGFDDEIWDRVKSNVVLAGNIAKFSQNRHLKNVLVGTGDRLLVEAASKDRVWGIGYTEKHAMNFRQHWGENRLGYALMKTRQHLRNEV